MTDAATLKKSEQMRQIRQKGTSAELAVGKALRDLSISYRKNVRSLPGSPDFANKSEKWAVFVNGCFWHRHTACARATIPKKNREFWLAKLAANRARDAKAVRALRALGIKAVVVWECETSDEKALKRRLSNILETRSVNMR